MMKRGIIFDYDGVVVDSWTTQIAYWQHALAEHGVSEIADTVQQRLIGLNTFGSAEVLVEEFGLDVSPLELAELRRKRLMADKVPEKLPIMPGFHEALARLKPDFAEAIVALRPLAAVEQTLRRNKLDFDGVIISEEAIADNLSQSDLLRRALRAIGLSPNHCLAVDDSRNGILAAKRIGLSVIAFDSNPIHDIDFSMADGQITSLDELVPELINQVIAT